MSSDRKQVVVLYAEAKLQKSMDLPGSLTVAQAKEEGMVAIRDHLNALPGVPPVSLDPDCTDFYPVTTNNNASIRSLKGNLTMVVYPEPPKGQRLTPSPFVDALQSAIHELRDVKAAAASIRETSAKNLVTPADIDVFLRTYSSMEEKIGRNIAELRRDMAELRRYVEISGQKPDLEELRQENDVGLKHDIKELSDQMGGATIAVLDEKVAIDPSAVTP
ncbi:hypothetical protein CY34DRAFT_810576 [Suillus luteus UH-Slu-Lm8-n1]|uniref:Uncharacterized protein n=1 Tax=Suillus luteus UH-Slu-Lm8-n1 TaxID=930992 RepID=A0A0D0AZ86_9AGAM|nr:hypothetical protein CY34DRAFT_810576 [Suillus luteus UH-Slu-Lm8-n1]